VEKRKGMLSWLEEIWEKEHKKRRTNRREPKKAKAIDKTEWKNNPYTILWIDDQFTQFRIEKIERNKIRIRNDEPDAEH
jgi:hypothetical protein